MTERLQVIPCEGIRPDSLGGYLAGLGLLAALTNKWRTIRGCWREGRFCLVGREISKEDVETYLLTEWQPPKYERWWREAQKRDSKAKADSSIWRARSQCPDLREVVLLDAHIVGSGRNQFNPVLGTGGNISRRDLAAGFQKALAKAGKTDPKAQSHKRSRRKAATSPEEGTLKHTLWGERAQALAELPAGTWFPSANRAYNSGQRDRYYQEGKLSPWSYLLALEGARLLTGSVNRRLSAEAKPYAVFPFVSGAPSPTSADEVGLVRAEFWAPLWERPATLVEVRALLERGLARVGNRSAKAPHEFALAARAASVDSGVSEFVRFALRQTTSDRTYEALPQERIRVSSQVGDEYVLLSPLLSEGGWFDKLPSEPNSEKRKKKFHGLRGPVERAIIKLTADPDNPERWQELLLVLASTQARIDRNKVLRERCIPLPLLNERWFNKAWPNPPPEIQVARAVASIGAGTKMPILVNIFGVEKVSKEQFRFPEQRPQRAVWHTGDPKRAFAEVLQRRLVDASAGEVPLQACCSCSSEIVEQLLAGALDWELIARWVPALSLIGWQTPAQPANEQRHAPADGLYMLAALFRPFFYPGFARKLGRNMLQEQQKPEALFARRLLNLIRQGEWEEATKAAQGRYRTWGLETFIPTHVAADPDLLAASLLVPMRFRDVCHDFRRWLVPSKSLT